MTNEPLVSCLCITRDRVPLLRRAVFCYLSQTYQPRELIVLYDADDTATRDYLATLSEPSIRAIEAPSLPRLRLGALRNLSLQVSRGPLVAQWDDDDWCAPARLAEQVDALRVSGKPACVLWRWLLYDAPRRAAFLSGERAWEGSLVAERAAVPPYPDLCQGEDVPVINCLWEREQLALLDRPDLYVYVYHGANTWDQPHWEGIVSGAQPLTREETERVSFLLAVAED
jgi:glycosyltransferase involved in cell wall biosynthesis